MQVNDQTSKNEKLPTYLKPVLSLPPEIPSDYRVFKNREERDKFFANPLTDNQIDFLENRNQEIFMQFSKFFLKMYKDIQRKRPAQISKNEKQISKISVLVIIGSGLQYFIERFINNYQILSNALLLRHLFHYALGIPYNQILITSCEKDDFPPFETEPVFPKSKSPKKMVDLKSSTSSIKTERIVFKAMNTFEFAHCVFSQVGEFQYQFIPDLEISNIIKPFNSSYIKQYLHTNNDSELFVFFLDHGGFGKFHPPNYNFIIEQLYAIPANHYIVFNDCSHSGSLLELIYISRKLVDIFQDNEDNLIKAFKLILSYAYASKQQSIILRKSKDKQDSLEKYEIEKQKYLTEIQELKPDKFDADKYKAIIEAISLILSKYPNDYEINPLLFVSFQQKASIFCSCDSNTFSFPLPIRDFYIGSDSTISAHGSIYLSCVIDCLFNKNFKSYTNEFVKQLQETFTNNKLKFESLVIEQNTIVEDDYIKTLNEEDQEKIHRKYKKTLKYATDFFATNYQSSSTFSSQQDLPDLSSLLIDRQYWPILIKEVDENDYKNLKIYHYLPLHETRKKTQEMNPYGPSSDYCDAWDFVFTFADYVNDHLPEDIKSYKYQYCPEDYKTFQPETEDIYGFITFTTIKYTNTNNGDAVLAVADDVKYNLEVTFKDHQEELINLCIEAFETMLPLWKDIFLYW